MSLDLNILHNLDEIEDFWSDLSQKVAIPATRSAINKAIRSTHKESIIQLKKRLKLTTGKLKKKYIYKTKAKGTTLAALEASVVFSTVPVSMINFVRGNKQAIKQKGIKVSKRRKLRVEITPGKKFHLRKAFIQKGKNNNYHVFKSDGKGKMIKQSAPSVAHVVTKALDQRLKKFMSKRFQIEIKNQMKFRLDRQANKANKAKLHT